MRVNDALNQYWKNYQKQYPNAEGISFSSVMDVCQEIVEKLSKV